MPPSQTDTNIIQFNYDHYVYLNTNVPSRGELFVLLPGSYGRPSSYTNVVKFAANLGFCAIGLTYPNGWLMTGLCGDSTNPDCYAETRLDIINGGTNDEVSIASVESITNRLIKLLEHLSAENPGGNYSQFLTAQSNLNWPKIVIAGHSQGAGHAAFIGKIYPVARVVMFSDTDWWTPNGQTPGQPANWISSLGVTSPEYYFAFINVQDGLIAYSEMPLSWDDLGLTPFGGPVLVESNSVPYFGSHELITGLTPENSTTGLAYHDSTCVDISVPLAADGVTPVYEPVWRYMMTGPPELPKLNIARLNPNQVRITFGTYTNYSYLLQATTDLSSGWDDIGAPIAGDGFQKIVNVNSSSAKQFYRIVVSY